MPRKLSPTGFTKAVWRSFMAESGLEPRLLGPGFRVLSASPGRVDFELDINKDHTNRMQMLHGGTIAAMVDHCGSLAVASMGRFTTGVTTDLNVTYLSPGGKMGDLLKGTAICDKIGKTLAFTTVTFTNAKGQLAARGSHSKYVAGTLAEDNLYVAPDKYSEDLD